MSEFEIAETADSVVVESERALQFEPKGWQKEMRADLRLRLASLAGRSTGRLYATYQCSGPVRCDIENVLIYNVGTPSFNLLSTRALVLELGPPLTGEWSHRMTYHSVEAPRWEHWRATDTLANAVIPWPGRGGSTPTLRAIWLALKHSAPQTSGAVHYGAFGLRLSLTGPKTPRVGCSAFVKTLVDGVVCAFQFDPAPSEEAVSRLAHQLRLSPGEVEGFLGDERLAPLGPRRLLGPFQSGVQWNPADDRCHAIELSFTVIAGSDWRIGVEVVAIERVGVTDSRNS